MDRRARRHPRVPKAPKGRWIVCRRGAVQACCNNGQPVGDVSDIRALVCNSGNSGT